MNAQLDYSSGLLWTNSHNAVQNRTQVKCKKYEDKWECKERFGKTQICVRQNLGGSVAAAAANRAQNIRTYSADQCKIIEKWADTANSVEREAEKAELQKKRDKLRKQKAAALEKKKEKCQVQLCKGNFPGPTIYKWFCTSSGDSRCICTSVDDERMAAEFASRNQRLQYQPSDCQQLTQIDRREEENRIAEANEAKAARARRREAHQRAEEERAEERQRRKYSEGVLEVDWENVVCSNEQDLMYPYNLDCPKMSRGKTTGTLQVAGNQLHVQKWFCSFAGMCPKGEPCRGVCPCMEKDADASAAAVSALQFPGFPGKWTSCRRFPTYAGQGVLPAEMYRHKIELQASSIASAFKVIDDPSSAHAVAHELEKKCSVGLQQLELIKSGSSQSKKRGNSQTKKTENCIVELALASIQLIEAFTKCKLNPALHVDQADGYVVTLDGKELLCSEECQKTASLPNLEAIRGECSVAELPSHASHTYNTAKVLFDAWRSCEQFKFVKISESKDLLVDVRKLSIGVHTSSGELTDLLNTQAEKLTLCIAGFGPTLTSQLMSGDKIHVDERIDRLSEELGNNLEDVRDAAMRVDLMNSVQPVDVVATMLEHTAIKVQHLQVIADEQITTVVDVVREQLERIQHDSERILDTAEDLCLSGESVGNIKSGASSDVREQIDKLKRLGGEVYKKIVVPHVIEKEELMKLADGENVSEDLPLIEQTVEDATDVYREIVAAETILRITREPDQSDGIIRLKVMPDIGESPGGSIAKHKLPSENISAHGFLLSEVERTGALEVGEAPTCPLTRHVMCQYVKRYLDEAKTSDRHRVPRDTCDDTFTEKLLPGCLTCCAGAFSFVYLQEEKGKSRWCPPPENDKPCASSFA